LSYGGLIKIFNSVNIVSDFYLKEKV